MATVARTPDAELLRRLRTRDGEAWDELYREYQPRLRGFGLSLAGNVHDADDLVQETFVRAVPRLDQLDPETTDVSAYLFTTMRNLFLKQVERGKRQQPVAEVPEPALPVPIEDDPERSTMLVRQQQEVRLANAHLLPRQRLVLALRELEDRSYAEIGELVGMKENAVAQLIFRARESLRSELRLAQVDPESFPEECRAFLPLLAAHLDGQLKGPRLDSTLAHLDGCDRCQSALADMREASKRYRALFPLVLGSEDAKAAIDDRLEAAGYWHRPVGRPLARPVVLAALGLVALLLGGGGAALGVRLSRDAGTSRAAATTASVNPVSSTGGSGGPGSTTPAGGDTTHAATAVPVPPQQATASTKTTAPKSTTAAIQTTVPPAAPAAAPPPTTAPSIAPPDPTQQSTPKPASQPKPKPKPKQAAPVPPPDATAPKVTITSQPPASVAVDHVQIGFVADEQGVTFSCRLDAGAFGSCSSPASVAGLSPGKHVLAVRARDKAGNVGLPATAAWTYVLPDTTAPTVDITSAPAASSVDTGARFAFQASESATFECSLDGAAFSACTSPKSNPGLALGPHAFGVRATDQAGNTGPVASHSWTVVSPLPDLYVSAFRKHTITVTNKGLSGAGARSILSITLVGTFTVPALPAGASATFSWSTCRVGAYSAIVDRAQAVAEANEQNNTASLANTCP